MKTVKELIEIIKVEANIEKSPRFTDAFLTHILDTAQRQIQMVIYNAYPQEPIFGECLTYERNDEQKYKLPLSKMLTPYSVHAVLNLSQSGNFSEPMPRVGIIERQRTRGYYLLDGFMYLTQSLGQAPRNRGVSLIYARLLPRLTELSQVSELSTICEEYLISWSVRKIHFINSSQDISNSQVFTQQQRKDIADLYADSARDPKFIPTLNDEYLAY
jgi:hypothetical protein